MFLLYVYSHIFYDHCGPLNSVTTLKKENLNKKVNKTIITTTEEHKMVKGEIDTKNSKDRSRSSSQKGTNNQGTAKQDEKSDKEELE